MRLTPRKSKNLVRGVTPPNLLHEQAFWSRLSPESIGIQIGSPIVAKGKAFYAGALVLALAKIQDIF